MLKIKICGITNRQDALWITNMGADYIGLNFYSGSPRKISIKYARELVNALPPFILSVGVFVNHPIEDIKKILKKCPLKLLQVHGDETVDYCGELKALNLPVIKAFRIGDESDLEQITGYKDVCDYILLDKKTKDKPVETETDSDTQDGGQTTSEEPSKEEQATLFGGTGETFDWDLAVKAKDFGKPIFLAGGLNPENITEAIEKVRPFAVDAASGVEKSPKRKDFDKVKDFINKAKRS